MAGHCEAHWPVTRAFCSDKHSGAEADSGRWGKDNKIACSPFDVGWLGSLWSKCTVFSGGLCAIHSLVLSLIAQRIKRSPG